MRAGEDGAADLEHGATDLERGAADLERGAPFFALYEHWERHQWSPFDLDFSVDRESFARLDEPGREALLWLFGHRFHGEAGVARHPGAGRRRFRRPRARRAAHRLHAWITGAEEAPLALPDALVRSVVLGSADTVAAARRHADLVIAPHLPDVEMLDYHRLEDALNAGRVAAAAALEQIPATLRTGG